MLFDSSLGNPSPTTVIRLHQAAQQAAQAQQTAQQAQQQAGLNISSIIMTDRRPRNPIDCAKHAIPVAFEW
ncbi:hypothetical protein EJ05DRAFT_481054 [Pseudovirgaria hyperparasitica]|uniref:Uncharacterized protein n=1 Tax=Pseudovirgaria hyperparasitica TaxID=470096 RepID=A0A6A6VTW5_9PEZI|nr:uncharacterized protein EJ05DRAFT_481054 [Pseudovirgaria hyperparasitica]KAF2752687.1 hypothetical protein EJ05DRAFT_481054 [Pseudovirgaria hyperparasitica]